MTIDTKELRKRLFYRVDLTLEVQTIEELLDRLEAAEKERDTAELMSLALRAKIAEMERQEPVGVLHVGSYYGEELQDWEFEANQCACDKLNEAYVSNPTSLPLYAQAGAKGETK